MSATAPISDRSRLVRFFAHCLWKIDLNWILALGMTEFPDLHNVRDGQLGGLLFALTARRLSVLHDTVLDFSAAAGSPVAIGERFRASDDLSSNRKARWEYQCGRAGSRDSPPKFAENNDPVGHLPSRREEVTAVEDQMESALRL